MNKAFADTSRSKFLGFVAANTTVFGVPGAFPPPELDLSITLPEGASNAKIHWGSLGTGGSDNQVSEALPGSALTATFQLGVPSLFLAVGAFLGARTIQELREISDSDGVDEFAINELIPLLLGLAPDLILGGSNSAIAKNPGLMLQVFPDILIKLFGVAFMVNLAAAISSDFTTSKIQEAIPFVGIAFIVMTLAADVATLVETSVEVGKNPALSLDVISLTLCTTIVIKKDPDDFRFPLTATRYEVTLTYDQNSKQARIMKGDVQANRVDDIVVEFKSVPSGGSVTIEVVLFSDNDCIIGLGVDPDDVSKDRDQQRVGPFTRMNVPEIVGNVEMTIRELLVPLTEQTQYDHLLKLEYQDGKHVWAKDKDAPTETLGDLCRGQDDALCALTNITVNQKTGSVGYAYEAGGQGATICGESSGTPCTFSRISFLLMIRTPS